MQRKNPRQLLCWQWRAANNGHRVAEVIRRLSALSRKTDPQKAPLDINNVVNEAITLVQREVFTHRVLLRTELAPNLPVIRGDRIQLQQVLINLVINGIEEMQAVTVRSRELVIRSYRDEAHHVLVMVKCFSTVLQLSWPRSHSVVGMTSKSSLEEECCSPHGLAPCRNP